MTLLRIVSIASVILVGVVNYTTAPKFVAVGLAVPAPSNNPKLDQILASFQQASSAEEPTNMVPTLQTVSDEDRECLAQNIYFEAGNQSVRGQMAVGIVTIKRVVSSRYPNTVCGVVRSGQRGEDGKPEKNKCQFSWYCDGRDIHPRDKAGYDQAKIIAGVLLSPDSRIIDFTHGADHYHADWIDPPEWADHMKRVAKIGNHIFYATRL